MEKFRKFDDPRCGVNPFVPLRENPRPNYLLVPRFVSKISLIILSMLVIRYVLILCENAVYGIRFAFQFCVLILEVYHGVSVFSPPS